MSFLKVLKCSKYVPIYNLHKHTKLITPILLICTLRIQGLKPKCHITINNYLNNLSKLKAKDGKEVKLLNYPSSLYETATITIKYYSSHLFTTKIMIFSQLYSLHTCTSHLKYSLCLIITLTQHRPEFYMILINPQLYSIST